MARISYSTLNVEFTGYDPVSQPERSSTSPHGHSSRTGESWMQTRLLSYFRYITFNLSLMKSSMRMSLSLFTTVNDFRENVSRGNSRARINSRHTTRRQKANISFCCSAPNAYPTMSNHTDEDPMDQDSCTSDEANLQLERELRQSREVTRTTTEPSQKTILVGISPAYVKGWDTTDAFRELYQNWYVAFTSIE